MAKCNVYFEDFSEDLLESSPNDKIENVLDCLQELKV